jgi:hypothetical protein
MLASITKPGVLPRVAVIFALRLEFCHEPPVFGVVEGHNIRLDVSNFINQGVHLILHAA